MRSRNLERIAGVRNGDALQKEVERLERQLAELKAQVAHSASPADQDATAAVPADDPLQRMALLDHLEQTMHFGSYTWDIRTSEVTWSAELYRILGLDPQQVAPSVERFFECVHPEDRPRIQNQSASTVRSGRPEPARCRIVRPDGTSRHVMLFGTAHHDQDGNLASLVGSVLDVTEQHQGDEERRLQGELLQAIFDHLPIGLAVRDREGRFRFANRHYGHSVSVASEQLVGRRMDEVPEIAARWGEDYVRTEMQSDADVVASGEEIPSRMVQRRSSDGEEQWVQRYKTPYRDLAGEIAGAICIATDVTTLKQAQDLLADRFDLLTKIMDVFPVSMSFKGVDGRFQYTNRQFCRVVGVGDPSNLVGKTQEELPQIRDTLGHAWCDEVLRMQARALASGETVELPVSSVRVPDGNIRYVRRLCMPVRNSEGQITGTVTLSEDVTEREQAARDLAASRERFRGFAESSSDWLWETDSEGRFTFAYEGPFRYRLESTDYYIGKRREDIAAEPTDTPKWDRYRASLAARDPIRDFIFARRNAAGVVDYIRINGVPRFDVDGHFAGYLGTARFVTEQVMTEQALQASEVRFRNLAENTLQGLIVTDTKGELLYANRAAARIFGTDAPEQLPSVHSVAPVLQKALQILQDEESTAERTVQRLPKQFELETQRADGSYIWLQNTAMLVTWDGQPAVQCAFIEITTQKQAAARQQQVESQFRTLIEQSALPAIVFDRAWNIAFLNKAALQMLGYGSQEEALAEVQSGWDIVHPNDVSWVLDLRRRRFADESVLSTYELRIRRRDGSYLWARNSVGIVEWEGRPATLNIAVDITLQKEHETHVRQAQKMEAIGQLTGGIAHDFNNLLTVIAGNLELLNRKLAKGSEESEFVRATQEAARRGSSLTQQLLAFSRKQDLQPRHLEVNGLLAELSGLLKHIFPATVEVVPRLADDTWPVFADHNQLYNAVLNVAINSRDAMPAGGSLTLTTENVRADDRRLAEFGLSGSDDFVLIEVADTGEGMAPEVAEQAFNPFFTTKEPGKGSGLGLSMVYGFVNQSYGHVTLHSVLGRGTTVRMFLPRDQSEQPVTAYRGSEAEAAALRGLSVLVVEDDPAVRMLAVAFMDELGCRSVAVSTGAEALQVLQNEPGIALLFSDVVLPGGMTGMELADNALRRYPKLKVLLTSGYPDGGLDANGHGTRPVNLIGKPYTMDGLARALREAVAPGTGAD